GVKAVTLEERRDVRQLFVQVDGQRPPADRDDADVERENGKNATRDRPSPHAERVRQDPTNANRLPPYTTLACRADDRPARAVRCRGDPTRAERKVVSASRSCFASLCSAC